MSYRRAWLLINDMNLSFRQAVVAARPGGSQGGGARLTALGEKLIRDYRAIEIGALRAAGSRLRKLEAQLRPTPRLAGGPANKTSIRPRKR
jgi:molybdate transport system regulatory protein